MLRVLGDFPVKVFRSDLHFVLYPSRLLTSQPGMKV